MRGPYSDGVGKAGAARKLASAAAFGGGGLSVLGAGLYGVLRAEAALARRTIGNAGDEPPPDSTGWYGRGRPGPAIKVALLGDSSAAGYGVDRVVETPGRAPRQRARRARPTAGSTCATFAMVGAQSSDLDRPDRPRAADRARPRGDPDRRQRRHPPGAAVAVGAPPRRGRTPAARRRRRGAGRHLPRPRHGQADPAPAQAGRPLLVAPARRRPGDRGRRGGRRRRSRWARSSGPEFAAAPALLFGPDQFHPSAEGYRALAEVLVPSAP